MRAAARVLGTLKYGPLPTVAAVGTGHQDTITTSISVTMPTGIQAGDLLLLFVATKLGTNTPTVPTGWTQVATVTASQTSTLFTRVADGTEGASLTVSYTSGARAGGVCVRLAGASGLGTQSAVNSGSGLTGTATSVTVTGPNRLLLGFWVFGRDDQALTVPSGMTSVATAVGSSGGAGTGISVLCAQENRPLGGATGTRASTTTPTAAGWHAWLVPVKPIPSPT